MADPVYTFSAELSPGSMTNITTLVERCSWDTSIVDMFRTPQVGTMMVEIANDGGLIGPRINSYSQPGAALQLTATYSGTTYALFYGRAIDISLASDTGNHTVLIDAVDDWDRLQDVKYTTQLFSGTPVQSLWTTLMSLSAVRSFDVSSLVTESCGYAWYHDHDAPTALHEIAEMGNYQVFLDGNGTYRLKEKNWSAFNLANTTNVDTRSWVYGFRSKLSRDTIYNRIRFSGAQRVETTTVCTIAYLPSDTPWTLPASSSFGFWFDFHDPGDYTGADSPVSSLITPVSSTDWYTTITSDGSGADMTSGCALAFTAYAASAVATFTNNTGSTVWINRAQVRGYPLRKAADLVQQMDIASSQTKYGVRTFTLQNRLLQYAPYVNSLTTHIASDRKDGMHEATGIMINVFPTQFDQSALGTIIGVTDPFSGPPTTWRVRGASHELTFSDGLKHTTTYELDTPQGPWGWGVPDWADAHIGQVILLTHADTVSTPYTLVDERGHTPFVQTNSDTGYPKITTTRSKFGDGAIECQGAAQNFISAAGAYSAAECQMRGNDWTMECWVYLTSLGEQYAIGMFSGGIVTVYGALHQWSQSPGGGNKLSFNSQGNVEHYSVNAVTLNAWQHWAVTMEHTAGPTPTFRLFLDGNLEAESTGLSDIITTAGDTPRMLIGDGLNGSIDDIRITIGLCRYTASFTPPTAPFSNI